MKNQRNRQFFEKKEKGQIIVIMALVFIGLIAIVGLAIDLGYLFVNYSRLRRGVDAAALAATSQFREGYTISGLTKEAQQFLELNGIGAVGEDPNSLVIRIETCESMPGYDTGFRDPELCTYPARKLVRVTVTQMVQLNFLSIVGIPEIPITVDAISEAASVDLVLLIDNSDSMTQGDNAHPVGGQNLNPHICNTGSTNDAGTGLSYAGYCHPMHEIKVAAVQLVNRLFPGYDRVSVITFDRYPKVRLEMSDNFTLVKNTIAGITVYEAEGACPYPGETATTDIVNFQTEIDVALPDGGTCRRTETDGTYTGMDCPAYWISGDPSLCGSTNIGGGLKAAGNALGGAYPADFEPTPWPPAREAALWVVVLLTDGQANTGYTADGSSIDPAGTSGEVICPQIYWGTSRKCADQDARPTIDDLAATPAPGADVFAARHAIGDPRNADASTAVYDPDDYARDMADFVTDPVNGQGALVFTIGLNENYIANRSAYEQANGLPAPAEALLRYAADRGGGEYYSAPSSDDLGEIFLAIANKIATRLSR